MPDKPYEKQGLLRVVSNAEIDDDKAEQAKKDETKEPEYKADLMAHVEKLFSEASRAKDTVYDRMISCIKQREGIYEDDVKAEIDSMGGCDIFMLITDEKCRSVESWIRDIMIPPGEKPWSIEPTPVPTLSPEVTTKIQMQVAREAVQSLQLSGMMPSPLLIQDRLEQVKHDIKKQSRKEADERAGKIEDKINDDLTEGKWYEALNEIIRDVAMFPTAFIEGPIVRKRKSLEWTKTVDGRTQATVTEPVKKDFRRISPFDIFPAPGVKNINDGYCFVRYRYTKSDFFSLIGTPGFDAAEVRAALAEAEEDGKASDTDEVDEELNELIGRYDEGNNTEGWMFVYKFMGAVPGKLLREWKVPGATDDEKPYDIICWYSGDHLLKVQLNWHPLGLKPIFSTSFEVVNDSIWGKCPPEIIRDKQRAANAAARALVNNMAIGSGPQVEVNVDRLPQGEGISKMHPWKIWQTTDDAAAKGGPAVNFYQPNMQVEALMRVYEFFEMKAAEILGVPNYVSGGTSQLRGAGNTASGLSMLLNNASKGLKQVVKNLDTGIVSPSVKEDWTQIMLFDQDEDIKGDIEVIARASEYLVMLEQLQVRRNEFAAMTNNPIDQAIIGNRGRAAILRELARGLKISATDVVPDDEELMQKEQQAQAKQAAAMAAQNAGGMGPGVPGQQPPAQTLNTAGEPMAGQDFNLMQQGG